MKKLTILLIFCLCLTLFASCDAKLGVDEDLTNTDAYTVLLGFNTKPEDYTDKTLAVSALSSVVYNFSQNRIDKRIMMGFDPNSANYSYYEIRTEDGKYPEIGITSTFKGSLSASGYMNVTSCSPAGELDPKYDVDALDMTANELNDFIKSYNSEYDGSEYFGKTIRIFGHCESTHDTLKWLLGLDSNGSATWDIELKRGNQEIVYPTAKSGTVNPVEIVGRLATYEENGIIYACITVDKISRVESVFK